MHENFKAMFKAKDFKAILATVDGVDWFSEHFGSYGDECDTVYIAEGDKILREYLTPREQRAFDFVRTAEEDDTDFVFNSYCGLGVTALVRLRKFLACSEGRADVPDDMEPVFFSPEQDVITEESAIILIEEMAA